MARTLDEYEYLNLMATIANYEDALRRIAIHVETDDEDSWTDPYGKLETISDIVEELKDEGYLA